MIEVRDDIVQKLIGFSGKEDVTNRIIIGDCIEEMSKLPKEHYDLVFADPPYNLQLENTLVRPNNTKVAAVEDDWDQFDSFQEYDDFTEAWLTEVRRVMKPNANLWVIGAYHNIFRVGRILQDLGFWIINDVHWIKANPMPNFRGVRLANATESMIWCVKDKSVKDYTFRYEEMKKYNSGNQLRSDWYFPICSGSERLKDAKGQKIHSTQKPLPLMERIIEGWTNEGDNVLDPFGGSGTTGEAAWLWDRNFTLIERDEIYVDWALTRFETKQRKIDLGWKPEQIKTEQSKMFVKEK